MIYMSQVKLIRTKHVRSYGTIQLKRITEVLTLKQAKSVASNLRTDFSHKNIRARVDTFENGYAVWSNLKLDTTMYGKTYVYTIESAKSKRSAITGTPSKQIEIKKQGDIKIATTESEDVAFKFMESETKKKRGFKVTLRGRKIIIKSYPMKKIPKPKISVKRYKMSKKQLLAKLQREDDVVLAEVHGSLNVRKSIYSNRTYTVEANARVVAYPEYDNDENVIGFSLHVGASAADMTHHSYYSPKNITQAIAWAKDDVQLPLSYGDYINNRWKWHLDDFEGLDDFESHTEYDWYELVPQSLRDEGWE